MADLSPDYRDPLTPAADRMTGVKWLICTIAAIGFAFDIYELLMLPLIVRDALLELLNVRPGTPEFESAVAKLFYIPAFAGGIFGLLGGYLTDRLGRRRVLTWSILLYAFSAFAAGYSTSFNMLLFFRCTTFIGVCVEFVAAVAWLAELFPNPEQREKVLGYTQAFSSVGGLMVTGAFFLAVKWGPNLPAVWVPGFLTGWIGQVGPGHQHDPWRYTLMSGLIPAIPLIVIRPFLPESPVWAKKKAEGTLRRPSILALFSPQYVRTTLVTTIIFACSYGAAFGAIQHLPRIVPGTPQVQEQVRAAAAKVDAANPQLAAAAAAADPKAQARLTAERNKVVRPIEQTATASYQTWQEVGGLVGRVALAVLAVRILSRRSLLRIFQVPGLVIVPLTFAYAAIHNPTLLTLGNFQLTLLHVGIFLAGVMTVAQFSFWGNYLPLVYPVHLRGTGESFAANIGGRMIGTSFAWVTATLSVQAFIPGTTAPTRLANTAALVAAFVYGVGLIASVFLPEPPKGDLHDDPEDTVPGGFPEAEARREAQTVR